MLGLIAGPGYRGGGGIERRLEGAEGDRGEVPTRGHCRRIGPAARAPFCEVIG